MKHKILTIIISVICCSAAAQQPLSLHDCIDEGLENNYDIRIARGQQQIAENNATAANAGMLPTLGLAASYSGALSDRRTEYRNGEYSSEKDLFDGALNAGLTLDWTVFNGLRARMNYKKLQQEKQNGELRTRIAVEDFIASLTAEYYNYIQQQLRLNNFRYAISLSRERLRITEQRFKIGNFSQLDLLQARVDFNADSSKYMSQQEAVTASRIRINELMATGDVNRPLTVADTTIDINESLVWDTLLAGTLSTNAEMLSAQRQTAISELELKAIQSRNYPYMNLSAGYGYTLNHWVNSDTKTRSTLGPNAGVRIGFTIFDGNRRREQRNARIEIENSKLSCERLEQSLLADLSNFWQAYRNNLELVRLEKQNLHAARQNYEISMERYLLGDLPGIEMREAQKSLLDAEERILTALYNTKLCEISLLQISGNLTVYLN